MLSKEDKIDAAIEGMERSYTLLDDLGMIGRLKVWVQTRPRVWRERRARRRARRRG